MTTIAVTQVLLGATDELAHQILDNTRAGANARAVLERLGERDAVAYGSAFVVFLLGLVAVVGAFLLWIELLIRASLLYLLIALSPLAYAAFVWPSARRVLRRLAEFVVALALSKVVIAIAMAVAASALTRGASSAGIETGEQKVGAMLVGVIMFMLATFAPFLILKLLPVVEAAVAAQGISRAPMRTAQNVGMTTFYLSRLGGTGSGGGATPPRAPGAGPGPTAGGASGPVAGSGGGPAAPTPPVPGGTARGGASGSSPPAPPARRQGSLDLGGQQQPPAPPP
ncbi:MAG: hypothetical protein WEG56_04350 [Chloroflexota bacterium]